MRVLGILLLSFLATIGLIILVRNIWQRFLRSPEELHLYHAVIVHSSIENIEWFLQSALARLRTCAETSGGCTVLIAVGLNSTQKQICRLFAREHEMILLILPEARTA